VYPESGYFTPPNWNFVDVISPDDLAREARGWIDNGALLVGGCCGTSPEHIRALAKPRAGNGRHGDVRVQRR
jgi:homocysteine S-methyltransferase